MSYRFNVTNNGIGYSFGTKHFRFSHRANSRHHGIIYWCTVGIFIGIWYLLKYTFIGMYWFMIGLPILSIKALIKKIKQVHSK